MAKSKVPAIEKIIISVQKAKNKLIELNESEPLAENAQAINYLFHCLNSLSSARDEMQRKEEKESNKKISG
jgi:hypothetical protein